MTEIYYLMVAFCFFIGVANWRAGLYCCVLMDLVRDPIRKIDPDQPVIITVAANVIWLGVLFGILANRMGDWYAILKLYPRVRTFLIFLGCALLPGSLLSLLIPGGWRLVVIGLASYLGPLIGVLIGFSLGQRQMNITRFMTFYSIANAVFMIGTVFEWQNMDIAGLGGMKGMQWIRYHEADVLDLISGFYRSPDILGIHAAHTVVFSFVLALRSQSVGRVGWLGVAMWAAFCLLLSGRRKSIGLPLVFFAAVVGVGMLRGIIESRRMFSLIFAVLVFGAGFLYSTQEAQIGSEYSDFASTIITDGVDRANKLIGTSIIGTLEQAGILGSGIGTATQGAHYSGVARQGAWQEDGVSRLFKELGVPGVVFVSLALFQLGLIVRDSFLRIPARSSNGFLHLCLFGIVVGNMASFAISHQQYSGDPCSALFVVTLLGAMLALPLERQQMGMRRASSPFPTQPPRQAPMTSQTQHGPS